MLISGFTFIRNAQKYDFPILECIKSMLPICDELVVNVGKSDDNTLELVRSIASPKIRIIESVWNDAQTKDGLVLSEQTNIALGHCKGRWALYLQADECLHEDEATRIRLAVESEDQCQNPVDGFKFKYLHFYGGYHLVQHPWNWYPEEIRIVRTDRAIRSFGDAQTFRKGLDQQILETKTLNAHVFHYGHARAPETMKAKINYFHRFWHGDGHSKSTENAYALNLKELVWFWGTHPSVYADRVQKGQAWSFSPKSILEVTRLKTPIRHFIVFGSGELAVALAKELRKNFSARVFVVSNLWTWFKAALRCLWTRNQNVLIDLGAEDRSWFSFWCWILDAVLLFKLRLAFVPSGRLSRFRKYFYTFAVWGKAEKEGAGFVVPPEKTLSQILKWVGLE